MLHQLPEAKGCRIKNIFSKPYVWCFTTYFAEGLPYTIIRQVSSLFLRSINVSLESIGLTSFFGLPWILKFLWAPHIDNFGTRRAWMILMQFILALLFIAIGLLIPVNGTIGIIAALFLIAALFAATNDIAIDGYYLAALDVKEQAKYVGFRVMAYRIAMMAGTGLVATIGTKIGWMPAFLTTGGMLLLICTYHRLFLPKCEMQQNRLVNALLPLTHPRFLAGSILIIGSVVLLYVGVNSTWYLQIKKTVPVLKGIGFAGWISIGLLIVLIIASLSHKKIAKILNGKSDSFYSGAFVSFMNRERIGILLAFIILLRTGEFLLSAMTAPFIVDIGIKIHYGWIQAAVGLPASIAGAMLGGYCISRFTLRRVLFPFLLFQNGSNLVYMLLAFSLNQFVAINTGNSTPVPIGIGNLITVAGVQGFDQFSGGLGTAVLMTFLMRVCRGEFKAAHYAIGSGLMSISGLFTGVASGFIASRLGYGWFFGVSFLLSIPGMLLAVPALRVVEATDDSK
jgi:MFS transporter, PAT family, beta-lactamase induction signal transducer AmpG